MHVGCASVCCRAARLETQGLVVGSTGSVSGTVLGVRMREGFAAGLEAVSPLLLDIHKLSREVDFRRFKQTAFDRIHDGLMFDTGFWGSGVVTPEGEPVLHSVHLHALPEGMTDDWERHKDKDVLVPRVLAGAGGAVILRYDEIYDLPIHRLVYGAHGVNNLLCTYIWDPLTRLYHVISFYRSDPEHHFDGDDKALSDAIVHHLIDANRLCRFHSLSRILNRPYSPTTAYAVVDRQGQIHEMGERFVELLGGHDANWQGHRLPAAMTEWISAGEGREGGLTARVHPVDEIYLMQLRPRVPADDLTQREFEVARMFSGGSSHKEIARWLRISPATVRNHLTRIYTKLRVDNRGALGRELASLVEEAG